MAIFMGEERGGEVCERGGIRKGVKGGRREIGCRGERRMAGGWEKGRKRMSTGPKEKPKIGEYNTKVTHEHVRTYAYKGHFLPIHFHSGLVERDEK